MLKRLIALIGALVLVFTLTIPCFADVTYDYEDELNVHDVDESFDGPVLFLHRPLWREPGYAGAWRGIVL